MHSLHYRDPLPCEGGEGTPERGAGAPLAGMRPWRRAWARDQPVSDAPAFASAKALRHL